MSGLSDVVLKAQGLVRTKRRIFIGGLVAAVVMGGSLAAYSEVVGSPEYRLAVAAANTFRNPGYNLTLSTQVSAAYMSAVSPGTDFSQSGLPGIQSAADAAQAISNISVTIARGSTDVLDPNMRFAVSYGKSTLMDFRMVKRTAYMRMNLSALVKQSPQILPAEALPMLRSQLRASIGQQNKRRGVSPATKSYNYRALQLFDGKTVAMGFASNTAAGRKWNRLVRPATNPQLTGVQQATAALMQALRDSIAGHTTVVDQTDDAIGDRMTVTFDVPGLLTALKPQLLELARQQAVASGSVWDAQQESTSFDQSTATAPATLTADVWLSGDFIKQLEFDMSQLDDPANGSTLPAKGLVLRMIFNRGSVTAPAKALRMKPAEANIAMKSMGDSAFGFLAAANGTLPLPLRRQSLAPMSLLPTMRELGHHTSERAVVWRHAIEPFLAVQR